MKNLLNQIDIINKYRRRLKPKPIINLSLIVKSLNKNIFMIPLKLKKLKNKIITKKLQRKIQRGFSFCTVLLLVFIYTFGMIPGIENYAPKTKTAEAATKKIRQEINMVDGYVGAASGAYATSSAIINIDPTKYSGAAYYFEVVASTSASISSNVYLKNTAGATMATVAIPSGTTAYTRLRSNAFSISPNTNFVALNQGTINWYDIAVDSSNHDVYAIVQNGDIYIQSGGKGNFVALGQTVRNWTGITVDSTTHNVYATVANNGIYIRTGGVGNFVLATGSVSRNWYDISVDSSNQNVYAVVYGGDIYEQTGGVGSYVALAQTVRNWEGVAIDPSNHDVYATVPSPTGDIYKQTGGTGNFVALAQTARTWVGISVDSSNHDVYAADMNGDLYKNTSGTGSFVGLGQTSRAWQAIYVDSLNHDVYALAQNVDIYKQSNNDDYVVVVGNEAGATKGVVAGKVIVLQSADPLTKTETQIEIGSEVLATTSTATMPAANPKYWYYDSSKWDGTPTFSAEVTFQNTQTSSTTSWATAGTNTYIVSNAVSYATIEAWGGGGTGGSATGNSGARAGGGAGGQYVKSTIAAVAGSTHTIVVAAASTASTNGVVNGNDSTYDSTVVVAKGGAGGLTSSGTSSTGGAGAVTGAVGQVVFAGGNGGDGTVGGNSGGGGGGAGSTGAGNSGSAGTAGLAKTVGGGAGGTGVSTLAAVNPGNAAGGGGSGGLATATTNIAGGNGAIGRVNITETHGGVGVALEQDNGAFGGWTFVKQIVTNGFSTSTPSHINVSFTPTTGKNYRLVASTTSSSAPYYIYSAKILVDQTSPTKLEPQYLLANTSVSATGLAHFDTLYDPAEWANTSNVYVHQIDSSTNSANSAKLQSNVSVTPADITNSTATGANRATSTTAGFTMPTGTVAQRTIDTNVLNTPIYASRILVQVGPNTPPTIVPNTADATNFGSNSTPTLEFTGTDLDADAVRYKVQIYNSIDNFVALGQTSSAWNAVSIDSVSKDVYATIYTGMYGYISKQTAGTGNFVDQSQTSRGWRGISVDSSNHNVYATVNGGDIYMQTGGTGNFIALSQTTRNWIGISVDSSNHNVYATTLAGDIYKQTGGTGNFIALSQTSRGWRGISVDSSNHNVYATVNGGDIYKQTGGTGDFIALGQTVANWEAISVDSTTHDVYVTDFNNIYRQKGGVGDFDIVNQTSRVWNGVSVDPSNGYVYASVDSGDIYKQTQPVLISLSGTDAGFLNTVSSGNTDPFTSGQKVSFTVQSANSLSLGTYYWKVKAIDPAGSGTYGSWTTPRSFSISSLVLSGIAYSSEGGTALSAKTVHLYKNGTTDLGTTTTNASGSWNKSASFASGDIITAYIDNDAVDANLIFISNGIAKSNIDLYGGALIVRHDIGTAITNANLLTGAVYGSTDMIFSTSTSNAITLNPGAELHVWALDTYTPGGTITTQGSTGGANLHIGAGATATLGSTATIAGNVVVDNGATLNINANTTVSGGSMTTAGTGIITTTSGTPTVTISGTGNLGGGTNKLTFYNLTTSGTGNTTLASYASTTANLVIGPGTTFSGTKGITVGGGSATGSGTINMTGGTFEMQGTGNYSFGGSSPWTFYNLAIGNGATASTTISSTGGMTVSNNFTIGATSKFMATSTSGISVGGSWTNSGTFYPSAGTVTMTSTATGQTVTGGTGAFYNLIFNGSGGDWTIQDSLLTIANNLTVTAGTLLGNGSLTVQGGNIIGNGTIIMTSGGSSGTFLSNISLISSGAYHTCAVSTAGNAYCWGEALYGKLGDGQSSTDQTTPRIVLKGQALTGDYSGLNLANIASISAGTQHTCAVSTAGNAYCWGESLYGRLGDGQAVTDRTSPVIVLKGQALTGDYSGLNLANIASISAGDAHSCAVSVAGNSYCWGFAGGGRLGDGQTVTNATTPEIVLKGQALTGDYSGLNLSNIISIAAGGSHSCAVSNLKNAYCWGSPANGELGDGQITTDQSAPRIVLKGQALTGDYSGLNLANIKQVVTGASHTCAVSIAGNAYCWGYAGNGRLGDGQITTDKTSPGIVLKGQALTGDYSGLNLANIASISARAYNSCAISTAGNVYCWGYAAYGQLGDGQTVTDKTAPGVVLKGKALTGDYSGANLANFSRITVGWYSACGLSTAGNAYCWGIATSGVLGDGQLITNQSVPDNVLWGQQLSSDIPSQVTIYGTGNFGGNSNWQFYNLTLGNGTTIATTTATGSGSVTVSKILKISANHTLDAFSQTFNLNSASTPLVISGTFIASSSTISYNATTSAQVILAIPYYNLQINPTSANTFSFAGNTTIGGNFTITGTSPTVTAPAILTIGGNFTNGGTFTHNSGTVVFNTSGTSIISSAANMTFNNITSTVAGKTIKFQKHTANVPVFTIAGALTLTGVSADNPIFIESDTAGSKWLVNFSTAQSLITNTSIKDSGCYGGSASVTSASIISRGNNNLCWGVVDVVVSYGSGSGSIELPSGGGTLVVGGTDAAPSTQWWNSSWLNRKKILLNNTASSENLNNFPILVSLSSSEIDYAKTKTGGADLRFVDADNATSIPYEIESWNASGISLVWVKVPRINASVATDNIWMYYNNPGASDAQSAPSVWDSNYKGVWHFSSPTSLTMNDSTSNANNGTNGGALPATGKNGGAASFSGSYINVGSSQSLQSNVFTYSAWINYPSLEWNATIIGEDGYYGQQLRVTDNPYYLNLLKMGAVDMGYSTTRGTIGGWAFVGLSYDVLGNYNFYINGLNAGSGTNLQTFGTNSVLFGARGTDLSESYTGLIDEIRMSNVVRSADWIKAEYNWTNSPNSYNTFSTEETFSTVTAGSGGGTPVGGGGSGGGGVAPAP